MITPEKIDVVLEEMHRTRKALLAARERIRTDGRSWIGTRETAAARRASMDLTRALADLRRT